MISSRRGGGGGGGVSNFLIMFRSSPPLHTSRWKGPKLFVCLNRAVPHKNKKKTFKIFLNFVGTVKHNNPYNKD